MASVPPDLKQKIGEDTMEAMAESAETPLLPKTDEFPFRTAACRRDRRATLTVRNSHVDSRADSQGWQEDAAGHLT